MAMPPLGRLVRVCASDECVVTQGKKERLLQKHRESNGLVDQINMDLTYAVCFNLANAVRRVLVAPYVVTAVCVCCLTFESTCCAVPPKRYVH